MAFRLLSGEPIACEAEIGKLALFGDWGYVMLHLGVSQNGGTQKFWFPMENAI